MRVAVIINPESGRQSRRHAAGEARVALARRTIAGLRLDDDLEMEFVSTSHKGHGAELAASYVDRGYDVVVAWGGDGTVNEVAGPLIGTRTSLGIVPSGSGDGLARGLGLPRDPHHAVRLAVLGPVGPMDVGMLGEHHFLNIGGIGFDAAVARAFNRRKRRGLLTYVGSGLRELWSYRPTAYRIMLDHHDAMDGTFQLLAFANGREYGNRLVLEASADPRDGQLNLVAVEDGSAWRQLRRGLRLALGFDKPVEGVYRRTVAAAVVTADRLLCHVDGETFEMADRIEVGIRPRALLVKGLT